VILENLYLKAYPVVMDFVRDKGDIDLQEEHILWHLTIKENE
jgi:hypothetical protein